MRKLNVALIDIGAGTSDIAITNYGTVTGYSMVPIAGDEITEAISNEYILDFKVAEQAKQKIVMNNQAEVKDILGFEQDRKSTRLNSSHVAISYAVFCLKKKNI